MKKTLLLAAMLLACSVSNATAVWDISIHDTHPSDSIDNPFTLTGQFTTADASDHGSSPELITSFTGFLNGFAVSLVPTSDHAIQGVTFNYDNLFYGAAPEPGWSLVDSFNNNGLMLIGSNGVQANLFAAGGTLIGATWTSGVGYNSQPSVGGDSLEPVDYIKFDHNISAVPEPTSMGLLLAGLTGMIAFRRRLVK